MCGVRPAFLESRSSCCFQDFTGQSSGVYQGDSSGFSVRQVGKDE